MAAMFDKLRRKQEQDQEKMLKKDEERLSKLSKAVLDFLATQEGYSVKDVKIVLNGIVKGVEKVIEHKTLPLVKETQAKSFKTFYEESERQAEPTQENQESADS